MVLGEDAQDKAQGIDALQNMEIIIAHKAKNHFIKESQAVLKGIHGKIGIPVSDCTEIVCGKLSGGVIDGSAVGDGTVFGKVDPQKGCAEYPEAGKPERHGKAQLQTGKERGKPIKNTEKEAQKQKIEERIIKAQADHIFIGIFDEGGSQKGRHCQDTA